MQKKLLLLTVIGCSISMYADDYTENLIGQYAQAFDSGSSVTVDKVHADQKAENEKQRTQARSHQCNGRHFSQPDEDSVTGRAHAEIEDEYNKKSEINNALHEGYKNNFGFGKDLEHRIYVMEAIYLDALDRCGKDTSCLRKYDAPAWEEISKTGFIDQRCSMAYDAVLYRGHVVLTREQKEKFAEDNPGIKEFVTKLNEVKQKVQDKIDLLKK